MIRAARRRGRSRRRGRPLEGAWRGQAGSRIPHSARRRPFPAAPSPPGSPVRPPPLPCPRRRWSKKKGFARSVTHSAPASSTSSGPSHIAAGPGADPEARPGSARPGRTAEGGAGEAAGPRRAAGSRRPQRPLAARRPHGSGAAPCCRCGATGRAATPQRGGGEFESLSRSVCALILIKPWDDLSSVLRQCSNSGWSFLCTAVIQIGTGWLSCKALPSSWLLGKKPCTVWAAAGGKQGTEESFCLLCHLLGGQRLGNNALLFPMY